MSITRTRWRDVPGRVLILIACALLGLTGPALTGCVVSKRVLIYGDSITWESQRQLRARGLEVKAFGGTAICDWLADMRRQAATKTVQTVYLEFVGNYFTPCVRNRA